MFSLHRLEKRLKGGAVNGESRGCENVCFYIKTLLFTLSLNRICYFCRALLLPAVVTHIFVSQLDPNVRLCSPIGEHGRRHVWNPTVSLHDHITGRWIREWRLHCVRVLSLERWKCENGLYPLHVWSVRSDRGIRTIGLECLTKQQEESANRRGRWLLEHTHTEAKMTTGEEDGMEVWLWCAGSCRFAKHKHKTKNLLIIRAQLKTEEQNGNRWRGKVSQGRSLSSRVFCVG